MYYLNKLHNSFKKLYDYNSLQSVHNRLNENGSKNNLKLNFVFHIFKFWLIGSVKITLNIEKYYPNILWYREKRP